MTSIADRIHDAVDIALDTDPLVLRDAIQAVLKVHRADPYGDRMVCGSCLDAYENEVDYPCPTVAAIAKALHIEASR